MVWSVLFLGFTGMFGATGRGVHHDHDEHHEFGWFFLVGVCLVLARLNYIDLLVLAMFDTVDSL